VAPATKIGVWGETLEGGGEGAGGEGLEGVGKEGVRGWPAAM